MSLISWTDITANPIHLIKEDGSHGGHWCQKISLGCLHCYAETQNQSNYFKFASHLPYSGKTPRNLIFDEKVMQELVKMRSPKKVFLCSMTDLFGEWVSDDWLDRAFAYMAIASQHTFQILTKRPERMQKYFRSCRNRIRFEIVGLGRELNLPEEQYELYETYEFDWPLANIWLGTSIENQKTADDRIPLLFKTPASVRFLSCEPLLEDLDLRPYLGVCIGCQNCEFQGNHAIGQSKIDWIIIGGESGLGARLCNIDWIRSLVLQSKAADTAVFVKQLGSMPIKSFAYIADIGFSHTQIKLKDRKGADINEFPKDLKIRNFP